MCVYILYPAPKIYHFCLSHACLSDIFRYQINLLNNFTDFREQIERHNFDHVVVFDKVLVKSLIGSNSFVSPAPMMILLSLCFSVKF